MQNTRSGWPLAAAGILLALFLAACGPATPPATDAPAAKTAASLAGEEPEAAAGIAVAGETVAGETVASVDESLAASAAPATQSAGPAPGAPATIAAGPQSAETTAEGIPVGFTVTGRPYMGNLDAPVVMEEYSDYQCPFCARFHRDTLPSLRQNQIKQGQLLFIYADFPLSIHPQAEPAAVAARCAGQQGAAAYWLMHDLLFENQAGWANGGSAALFRSLAEEAGLEAAPFAACLEANDRRPVRADFQDGLARGVNSTPSFFLNDLPLVGAQPLDIFNQAIASLASGETVAAAPPPAQPAQPLPAPTPATLSDQYAFALGDPNAPVKIVEFTDYQCPYCLRHFTEVMPLVKEELIDTGRVYYVIKDLPLENIHAQARLAHNAARCAGEQGAYLEMHDRLFQAQAQWAGDEANALETMVGLATELGLNPGEFEVCLRERRYDSDVAANISEAFSLGARGTPFFFVNGYPLTGARPIEHFRLATQMAEEGRLAEAFVPRPQPTPVPAPPTPSGPVELSLEGATLALGNPQAPVTMVEYTDFQCPFCRRHHLETFPRLVADYVEQGMVYYVVKDFPLQSIHPQATLAAEAVRCAGEQGDASGLVDLLFANQGEWSQQAEGQFAAYAGSLGLDAAAFSQCLADHRYLPAVQANLQEGIQLGIGGTPTFFLNGNVVSGAQPFEVFAQAIEQLAASSE